MASDRELRRTKARARELSRDLERTRQDLREARVERDRFAAQSAQLVVELGNAREACDIELIRREGCAKKQEKADQEKRKQRMRGAARAMCRTFGWDKAFGKRKEDGWAAGLTGRRERKDEDFFDAALGFWMGCQKEGVDGKTGRAGSVFRKELLRDLAKWSFKGELWEEIKREIKMENRASPVRIAKMQDMESSITPRALQGIRECLPSYEKGKHGMELPSQSCVNVPKEQVYAFSKEAFGSTFENDGRLWRWDMKRGVHTYLKRKYVDLKAKCTKEDPFIVCPTGDGLRVSQRGASMAMCGLKVVDRKHPETNGTGKSMNQSPHLYTPAICALGGEKETMPAFREMVKILQKVENQGDTPTCCCYL